MISRIKVTLQFYKSISSIETSSDWSHREKVELPKDKNLLLRFNKRIVTDMRIIGQLSPNEVSSIILLPVLMIVYSLDCKRLQTVFGGY